jgi:hypothetical protein
LAWGNLEEDAFAGLSKITRLNANQKRLPKDLRRS